MPATGRSRLFPGTGPTPNTPPSPSANLSRRIGSIPPSSPDKAPIRRRTENEKGTAMHSRREFSKLLALSTALVAGLAVSQAAAQSPVPVRLGADAYTTGAQIWVAKDKGYFKEEGIDPQVSIYATGIESLDAVLTGRTDIGVGLDFPTALRMQSRQLTILASIFKSNPGWHKLAVSDKIKGPQDLAGKTYGIASGTAQHLVTVKYLENHGVSADKVTLTPFSSLIEIVASLKAGRLDGAFVWADGTKQATDSGYKILADDSEAKLNQRAYINANTAFAKAHPDAVVNALKAIEKATVFINEHKEEAAAIIASNTKAPKDTTYNLLKLNDFQLELTDDDRTSFKTIADFASGVLKTKVSFETAVDSSYLAMADPTKVKLSK
ncbi:ABC transporter substrate-binding protein [Neorhizobium petrolearium]